MLMINVTTTLCHFKPIDADMNFAQFCIVYDADMNFAQFCIVYDADMNFAQFCIVYLFPF